MKLAISCLQCKEQNEQDASELARGACFSPRCKSVTGVAKRALVELQQKRKEPLSQFG
jgi:hypothetical protein